MLFRSMLPCAALLAAGLLAGCADNTSLLGGNGLATASVTPPPAPKVDPACTALGQQIVTLRSEGIADKIERAAAKKYKMNAADLTKADQLTKASAEFEAKCATVPLPAPVQQAAAAPAPKAATPAKPAKATTAAADTPAPKQQ